MPVPTNPEEAAEAAKLDARVSALAQRLQEQPQQQQQQQQQRPQPQQREPTTADADADAKDNGEFKKPEVTAKMWNMRRIKRLIKNKSTLFAWFVSRLRGPFFVFFCVCNITRFPFDREP